MTIEPNVGQAIRGAEFVARGKGMAVALTREGITVRRSAETRANAGATLNMQFAETGRGSRKISWRGEQRLRGESNYFLGREDRLWRTHVALRA